MAAPNKTADWKLRRAVAADLPELAALEKTCFDRPWSITALKGEVINAFSRLLIAHRDEEPARVDGYACLWLVDNTFELQRICVHPALRGQGLGGWLLDRIIARAREEGLVLIRLELRKSNTLAGEMYLKRGFGLIGGRKGYYPGGEDALLMELVLG